MDNEDPVPHGISETAAAEFLRAVYRIELGNYELGWFAAEVGRKASAASGGLPSMAMKDFDDLMKMRENAS